VTVTVVQAAAIFTVQVGLLMVWFPVVPAAVFVASNVCFQLLSILKTSLAVAAHVCTRNPSLETTFISAPTKADAAVLAPLNCAVMLAVLLRSEISSPAVHAFPALS